jgi:hypothetical protein
MAALAGTIGSESFETGSTSRSGLFFDRRQRVSVLCVYYDGAVQIFVFL